MFEAICVPRCWPLIYIIDLSHSPSFISHYSVTDVGLSPAIFVLFNNNDEVTTDTDEKAIARAANSGLSWKPTAANSPAAIGIPTVL